MPGLRRRGCAPRLAQAVIPLAQQHPEHSGIFPLAEGLDAFAARYLLIAMAERSLDIQYYIWQNDMSGRLLFSAVLDAAQRGVKVRLLLDDNNTRGLDDTLSELNRHPNIAVRLFNPFSFRTLRAIGYITDFARLNRRMHNKSFTVDNTATIVGGRNIGDEYFAAGEEPLFTDLDVLAVGPAVDEVAQDFDRYWQSKAVAPLNRVVDKDAGNLLSSRCRKAGATRPRCRATCAGSMRRHSSASWKTSRCRLSGPGPAC